jgi:hypothetical protein
MLKSAAGTAIIGKNEKSIANPINTNKTLSRIKLTLTAREINIKNIINPSSNSINLTPLFFYLYFKCLSFRFD